VLPIRYTIEIVDQFFVIFMKLFWMEKWGVRVRKWYAMGEKVMGKVRKF